MKIQDSVFLISGGASGLGAATARRFVNGGARVVLMDLNDEQGKEIVTAIGKSAMFVKANVIEEGDVQAAIDQAKSNFGFLTGAISCAGIGIAERTVGMVYLRRFAAEMMSGGYCGFNRWTQQIG
jgi:NAD(P)-dependent dehydrogenase (short-subunit alcohol dehydrogenase family)